MKRKKEMEEEVKVLTMGEGRANTRRKRCERRKEYKNRGKRKVLIFKRKVKRAGERK